MVGYGGLLNQSSSDDRPQDLDILEQDVEHERVAPWKLIEDAAYKSFHSLRLIARSFLQVFASLV